MKMIAMLVIAMGLSICVWNCTGYQPYNAKISSHEIQIQIDVEKQSADVEDQFVFSLTKPAQRVSFLLNRNTIIREVQLDGMPVEAGLSLEFDIRGFDANADAEDYQHAAALNITFPEQTSSGTLNISYTISAMDSINHAAFSREYLAYEVKGYIGEKGVFLSPSFFWYPQAPGSMPTFRIHAKSPENLTLLTQGQNVAETVSNGKRLITWQTNYPTDELHLIGSTYQVQNTTYNNIEILTYFFPESQDLAQSYLNACRRYLAMYEEMIGPYPFSKFAVVENFFPTGYGMPSYTLLGSMVIRLPFIIYTSLGHEVAHNWWGNSVYVDYDNGNWCEGLTTYFADYHYKEVKDAQEAMRYRRNINRDFTVYVRGEKDFPLSEFKGRTESSSRAIGYGKSAMVFHQLRQIVGDSLFFATMRRFFTDHKFKKAGWQDIQSTAETVTGENLDWFFRQWIGRPGGPKLALSNVEYQESRLVLTLNQTEPAYRLLVPVQIQLKDSAFTEKVWLEKSEQAFSFPVSEKPTELAIDPGFDVFRKLDRQETVPSLAEMYAHDRAVMVLPDRCSEEKTGIYRALAGKMVEDDEQKSIKAVSNLTEDEIRGTSLYLLGTPAENSLIGKLKISPQSELEINGNGLKLNGQSVPLENQVAVLALRDEESAERNLCIIAVGSGGQTGRIGTLLSHYGKYSYLVFTDGRNSDKGIYTATGSPLVYKF